MKAIQVLSVAVQAMLRSGATPNEVRREVERTIVKEIPAEASCRPLLDQWGHAFIRDKKNAADITFTELTLSNFIDAVRGKED